MGWLKLGTAFVTITLDFDETAAKLAAAEQIKDEMQKLEAETERKLSVMREAVNRLLAISYDAPAPEEVDGPEREAWRDNASCIITGCWFQDTDQGDWYWGDLHSDADQYYFNCAGSRVESSQKTDETRDFHSVKAIEADLSQCEIRHDRVIVIPSRLATLSHSAEEYINRAPEYPF